MVQFQPSRETGLLVIYCYVTVKVTGLKQHTFYLLMVLLFKQFVLESAGRFFHWFQLESTRGCSRLFAQPGWTVWNSLPYMSGGWCQLVAGLLSLHGHLSSERLAQASVCWQSWGSVPSGREWVLRAWASAQNSTKITSSTFCWWKPVIRHTQIQEVKR